MRKAKKLKTAKVAKQIEKLSQEELVVLLKASADKIYNIDNESHNHGTCGCCGMRNWSGQGPRHYETCEIIAARLLFETLGGKRE